MSKRFLSFSFAVLAMMSFSLAADAQTRDSVSATEVNGTFRMNFKGKFSDQSNEIKILSCLLGGGKIRVAMDLLYPYTLSDGERTADLGNLDGEGSISVDTAIYKSAEFGPCLITIKFVKPGTIKITQDSSEGDCGFGHNVTANGTYRKVSGKKPKFEER